MPNCEAITELLKESPAEGFSNALTEFWECWLTHEQTDLVPANERGEMLWYYKNLQRFLQSIEVEDPDND